MTARTQIYTALTSALPGVQVYPVRAWDAATSLPLRWATYQIVSREYSHDLDGDGNLDYVRVQIDFYSADQADAEALSEQARSALYSSLKALAASEFETFDGEARRYRVSIDFTVWIRRP